MTTATKTDYHGRDAIVVIENACDHPALQVHSVVRFPGQRPMRRKDLIALLGDRLEVGSNPDRLAACATLLLDSRRWGDSWVDASSVRGILALRKRNLQCSACGGFLSFRATASYDADGAVQAVVDRDQQHIHFKCLMKRIYEEQERGRKLSEVHRTQRQLKLLRKIAELMDVPMTISEASALLPWRPHKSALLRMVVSKRLESVKVGGERRLRGRDLLPLVSNWVGTGREPWRRSNKAREARQRENPCLPNHL